MTDIAEQLKQKLSQLSGEDRAELARYLLETLEEDPELQWEQAWSEEIRRRVAEVESGADEGIPAEEAFELARKRLESRQ